MLERESTGALRNGRRLTLRVVAVCGVSLLLGGCVTRADFDRVKRDQQEMRAHMADMQVAIDAINRRLDTVRASVSERGGTAAEVAAMRKKIAELEERSLATPTPTASFGDVNATETPVPPRVPGSDAAPLAMQREAQNSGAPESYRKGLQLYREGQAEASVQQFREFLRANPKSPLADNAQYWIGEAYYTQSDYNRSIIELNEVLLKYPQGDQVPGALLALATSFSNSGDKIDAKLILQKLISDHPKSEEAQLARQQLQTLAD
ncbi:MAG: tol-pal system protein YbgF [Deltaproteobacteria bacterium]|nr:tol-pal system protein YbgF [Deltaproteobacteria bacterium]